MLQLEEIFGQLELIPEVPGHLRRRLARALQDLIDVAQEGAAEVFGLQPGERPILLVDDRVVGGIIVRETKDAVTVRTVNDTLTIPTADIVTRKQTPVSLMPEGLFDAMKPDEVRDLVAYLRAKEQVPIPKR